MFLQQRLICGIWRCDNATLESSTLSGGVVQVEIDDIQLRQAFQLEMVSRESAELWHRVRRVLYGVPVRNKMIHVAPDAEDK
jgi:hypothetical protein